MGLPGSIFICIISQSPFKGPLTGYSAQDLSFASSFAFFPQSCWHTSAHPLQSLLPLWLPILSCHLQLFPHPNPCTIHNELSLPKPLQNTALPAHDAAMAPCYSSKTSSSSSSICSSQWSDFTDLSHILSNWVTHFPAAPPPPLNLHAQDVNIPHLARSLLQIPRAFLSWSNQLSTFLYNYMDFSSLYTPWK